MVRGRSVVGSQPPAQRRTPPAHPPTYPVPIHSDCVLALAVVVDIGAHTLGFATLPGSILACNELMNHITTTTVQCKVQGSALGLSPCEAVGLHVAQLGAPLERVALDGVAALPRDGVCRLVEKCSRVTHQQTLKPFFWLTFVNFDVHLSVDECSWFKADQN